MADKETWDAICVGAGITSLAFGALVAKKNGCANILVLDKHIVPGGYATQFKRKRETNAIFDCSLHKIAGANKLGGNFLRVFRELGLEKEIDLVDHPHCFEACIPNLNIELPNDPNLVASILMEHFPKEKDGIHLFFDELRVHGKDAYFNAQILDGSYAVDMKNLRYAHSNFKNISVKTALAERIGNPYLREILAAPCIYVGGYAEEMSYLYFLHVVFATLCMGNSYVAGSSQKLSNVLSQRIKDAGGCVKLKTNVTGIIPIDGGSKFQVNTSRGSYFTKQLYINSSPRHAIEDLFEKDSKLEDIKIRLSELKPARSTTTLYITTDVAPRNLGLVSCETMIFGAAVDQLFVKRRQAELSKDEFLCEEAFWRLSPMEVTEYYSLNPAGGYVICLNVLDQIFHWPERGTKMYKEKKERAKLAMLERLFAAKPGCRGHILFSEVATPRTYLRFTNNDQGSGFGTLVSPNSSNHSFDFKFPYKNVNFLSSWVAGPGYEAAFVYAERMASKWFVASLDHS